MPHLIVNLALRAKLADVAYFRWLSLGILVVVPACSIYSEDLIDEAEGPSDSANTGGETDTGGTVASGGTPGESTGGKASGADSSGGLGGELASDGGASDGGGVSSGGAMSGGQSTGGAGQSTGGQSTGGQSTGGSGTGAMSSTGGAMATGGGETGGGDTGGTGGDETGGTGGMQTGGANTGGAETGGAETGGASTGGTATGGAATGGASTGGAATGGAGTGGTETGGAGTGGSAVVLSLVDDMEHPFSADYFELPFYGNWGRYGQTADLSCAEAQWAQFSEAFMFVARPDASGSALQVSASDLDCWGVGVYVNLQRSGSQPADPVDLTVYDGISFFARAVGPENHLRIALEDSYSHSETCVEDAGCNEHGYSIMALTVPSVWTEMVVPLATFIDRTEPVDLEAVYAIHFSMDPDDDGDHEVEFWYDDLSFYSE